MGLRQTKEEGEEIHFLTRRLFSLKGKSAKNLNKLKIV